jgi:hypothetical protein
MTHDTESEAANIVDVADDHQTSRQNAASEVTVPKPTASDGTLLA